MEIVNKDILLKRVRHYVHKTSTNKIIKANERIFELIQFYDTHYGELNFYRTKEYLVIQLHNGGWSENEAIESKIMQVIKDSSFEVQHIGHPVTILKIKLCSLINFKDKKIKEFIQSYNDTYKGDINPLKNLDKLVSYCLHHQKHWILDIEEKPYIYTIEID